MNYVPIYMLRYFSDVLAVKFSNVTPMQSLNFHQVIKRTKKGELKVTCLHLHTIYDVYTIYGFLESQTWKSNLYFISGVCTSIVSSDESPHSCRKSHHLEIKIDRLPQFFYLCCVLLLPTLLIVMRR